MAADDIVDLTQADADALGEMYRNQAAINLQEAAGGTGVTVHLGEYLIAVVTGSTGCGQGYVTVDLYQPDPLLFDPTTDMAAAKLGSGDRSKLLVSGYSYSWDAAAGDAEPLAEGTVFDCIVKGTNNKAGGDGKPIVMPVRGGGSLPTGEYQYMILQMGSDNQVVYDFARAHPIVSG